MSATSATSVGARTQVVPWTHAIEEAVETAAGNLDCAGPRALRILLHAGASVAWRLLSATSEQQVNRYERMVAALRQQPDASGGPAESGRRATRAALRAMDDHIVMLLQRCAKLSGTQWLEPVESIALYVGAVIQGTVLRWLADPDEEAVLVLVDDLVCCVAAKAV